MKYFIIAGEASGDLHAANLMYALRKLDPSATFRCYGGDAMEAAGGELLCHYRHLAYMGFIPVLLHLRTILKGMARCKREIAEYRPDAVILVDYPGFNLKIARYVRSHAICPVFYYIAPKIWAWKEGRIHAIRRDISALYSILPFEPEYFRRKHNYGITYVGNPTVDEIAEYKKSHPALPRDERLIALLPGSRTHEIRDNLSRMLQAVATKTTEGYRVVIAAAPSIDRGFYDSLIAKSQVDTSAVSVVSGETFRLLSQAGTALVTSGTATLETALFGVPQVVCYYVSCGRLVSFLRKHLLKVPYVSLVNLVCGREVVTELVADGMTPQNARHALEQILPGTPGRETLLKGYEEMNRRLGEPGAPERAATDMIQRLKS